MTQILTLHLPDAAATHVLGVALGRSLPAGTILLLSGDLGAGKTSLVQGIGAGLGITEPITSPTFTLIQEYLEGRIPLYHLDLYRLGPVDVPGLFLEQYWDGVECPLGIMAIEWAERLPSLPESHIKIDMTVTEGDRRTATLQAIGDLDDQLSPILDGLPRNDFVL